MITSGLRIGTPAVTTLGMGEPEMRAIARILKLVIANISAAPILSGPNAGKPSKIKYEIAPGVLEEARAQIQDLLRRFPVYPEIDLEFLQEHFG